MTGEGAKCTRVRPSGSLSAATTGMFEIARRSFGTSMVRSKTAFCAGSSKQGKARRALVASNCVVPRKRFVPSGRV